MKILKSGIEMDPADLRKIKGGACACGCGIAFNGESLNISGDDSSGCDCGCITPPDYNASGGNFSGAFKQIQPPVGY